MATLCRMLLKCRQLGSCTFKHGATVVTNKQSKQLHSFCSVPTQGVLLRMEEEIARLSQDLGQKEDTMTTIQSSLGELSHRMDTMEKHTKTIGTHHKKCMYMDDENTHVVLPLYNVIQENITSLAG